MRPELGGTVLIFVPYPKGSGGFLFQSMSLISVQKYYTTRIFTAQLNPRGRYLF
jgi:hypothetical protein